MILRRTQHCDGKLSVHLSVRDVEVSWSYRLKFLENNFAAISLTFPLPADSNMTDLLQREHPKFYFSFVYIATRADTTNVLPGYQVAVICQSIFMQCFTKVSYSSDIINVRMKACNHVFLVTYGSTLVFCALQPACAFCLRFSHTSSSFMQVG